MKPNHNHVKAWLISVDMGYGHQRAAFPLKFLAEKNQIISANNYPGISASDRKIWREAKKFYEFVSRFKKFPIIGPAVWELYDSLQEIPKFYPRRDLSKLSFQVKKIFLTGFPLPLENIGNLKLNLLNKDLVQRLVNLDPKKKYWSLYHGIIKKYLGISQLPKISNHLLTLTFAVGGAGAQKEIGAQALNSLRNEILTKKIRLVLVAGIHNSVSRYFRLAAKKAGLGHELERGVKIIFSNTRDDYFKKFNAALRQTDILWTKPSELSFYCALGIPIVMSPPIGSQEEFNRKWLRTIGAAAPQGD